MDSGTLRSAERSKPNLERWLSEMAKEDGVVLASCGEDGDSLRKALCAGSLRGRRASEATRRSGLYGPTGKLAAPALGAR